MATTLGFKALIDLPVWQPISNALIAHAVGIGWAFDLRNSEDRNPWIYQLSGIAALNAYSVKNDEHILMPTPALATSVVAGAGSIFSTRGPRGVIAAGATTSSVVLSTALPAAAVLNSLANRGDGIGYKIRIVGLASGKTEERYIVNNTAGTTPTLYFDSPLSFTPATSDIYEFLSGTLYLLGSGAIAANSWKSYDLATGAVTALSNTNLPTPINTDSAMVVLDENYVPADQTPGAGYFGRTVATATTATTITGPAASFDAVIAVNEYRNFQIRIVQDVSTPTAVGQRRRITSHTAGPSVVYTVPAWSVTPSATATYVLENDDGKILLWTTASANTFTYIISANTWDTTTFGARGGAIGAGLWAEQAFGMVLTSNRIAQHSWIYTARGGAVSTIDLLDISGGANGTWSNAISYGPAVIFGAGSCAAYDSATNSGKYLYINQSGLQRGLRFDMKNRTMEPYGFLRYPQGAAVAGGRMAYSVFVDGATKLGFVFQQRGSAAEMFRMAVSN